MTDRELMQQAADKLSIMVGYPGLRLYHEDIRAVLTALQERLAQPEQEQEPVIGKWSLREVYFDDDGEPISHRSPPQRKPLTHPQIHELDWPDDVSFDDILRFVRAIEAKIKENT